MIDYIIRRLLLLPLTLFGIVLVNFAIINLAPGEPTAAAELSYEGQRRDDRNTAFSSDERYLQMREHFGLTLPLFFNFRPWITEAQVISHLKQLTVKNSVKEYDSRRIKLGDQSRFIMPHLLSIVEDVDQKAIRQLASHFFARGGTRQAIVGPFVTREQRIYNQRVAVDNRELKSWIIQPLDSAEEIARKILCMRRWYEKNRVSFAFEPSFTKRWQICLFETRFFKYMSRILTLDFGTLRNDDNKTVIGEVTKRFKYSLTLAITPMLITLALSILFGFAMALYQNRAVDISLNLLFLTLYATPVFVVAPFLIENYGLHGHFPFTSIAIPYSGFVSKESLYDKMSSWQRLWDILQHIYLPIIATTYGGLATQSRLARTAILEVLSQDYIRTARAKGVALPTLLTKHVARNASITIITSIAGSLGVILGGSLVVETLFEINGFGKFFYDAVVNWDYNVIMFSALSSAFLTLVGYLVADIAYTLLDPRVTLD